MKAIFKNNKLVLTPGDVPRDSVPWIAFEPGAWSPACTMSWVDQNLTHRPELKTCRTEQKHKYVLLWATGLRGSIAAPRTNQYHNWSPEVGYYHNLKYVALFWGLGSRWQGNLKGLEKWHLCCIVGKLLPVRRGKPKMHLMSLWLLVKKCHKRGFLWGLLVNSCIS